MNVIRNRATTLAVTWLIAACGGGADTTAPASVPSLASTSASSLASSSLTADAAPATVQLEGCVLGPGEQPRAARVQALGEDGRHLAAASSNADGLFVMRVPARQHLRLVVDAAASESLPLLTGESPVSLGGCLRDRSA